MREFPALRLDTANQCLWCGDGVAEKRISLDPKVFDVLRYLGRAPRASGGPRRAPRRYNHDSMPALPEVPATIEFGRFKVVRHRRELLADDRPVELGGRAFDTLMALIDARGTVLDKNHLMSLVWPDRVVEGNNLPAQIAVLRKVFGADRHLIRTVARRGYQFTGEIHTAAAAAPSPPLRMTNLSDAASALIGRAAELAVVAVLSTEHP